MPKSRPAAPRVEQLAAVLTLAIYVQIILGAQLRHLPPDAAPGWAVLWVWLKLVTAGLIAVGVVWLLVCVLRHARTETILVRRAMLLVALLFAQLVLGAGTWVTNFGWPAWFKDYVWAIEYTVVAEGRLQVVTTTVHVAAGSLNLAAALSLWLWSRRMLRGAGRQRASG